MNIYHRAIIKLPIIAEIVCKKYFEANFPKGALKLFLNHWNSGSDMCTDIGQSNYSRRECKRNQEGNAPNL